MPAYLTNAPAGFPGDVSRPDVTNIEPGLLEAHTGVFAGAYGIPIKFTASGNFQQFTGSEAATAFQGVLVREAPFQGGALSGDSDISGGGVPNSDQVQGLAVRGYVMVSVAAGTPVRGGVVYVQVTANGGVAVGSFRADGTDSGNAVALTNAQAEWATNDKDANGLAEIRIAR